MSIYNLSNPELARQLGGAVREWRLSPEGAGMTQTALSEKSGVSLTSIKRFEKTGGITFINLIALLRALGLLDRLDGLIPSPGAPGPLDVLEAEQAKVKRKRAPRSDKGGHHG